MTTEKRVATILQHLQPETRHSLAATLTSSATPGPAISTIILGDKPELWRKAGFNVNANGVTSIGSVCIRLLGTGGGLLGLALQGVSNASSIPHMVFPGVPVMDYSIRKDDLAKYLKHPNGATSIGELVVYSQEVEQAAQSLEELGVPLFKPGVRLKPLKGAMHQQIKFMLGGIRIILLGPMDKSMPPESNPNFWMFPKTLHCPTVLMGWLPIVSDIGKLKALLGEMAGDVKEAVQRGRQICSMPPEKSNLTGTFAFLSDGAGGLFD